MTTCTAYIDRRAFLDRAAKFAVGGMTAVMLLDLMNPKFAEAQVVPKDDKRLKTEWVEIDVAERQRQDQGVCVPPGQRRREAARHPRGPREPRPQSAHRRHRAAPRPRQLHGGRAGRADAARRLSRRRRQGAHRIPEARSAQDPRGLHRRHALPAHASGLHRQDRRGRLLLRRRDGELPRHSRAGTAGQRPLLRRRADRWKT